MLAESTEAAPRAEPAAVLIDPIDDRVLIAETLAHPRIYPHITDDFSPPAAAVIESVDPQRLHYVGAYTGGEYLGLFVLHPHSTVLWEVHTCLLPRAWGPTARTAARACIAWAFATTPCRRLITSVPAGNVLALRLARAAGMTQYGVNHRAMLRGGELVDLTMLGVSKEEGAPCLH